MMTDLSDGMSTKANRRSTEVAFVSASMVRRTVSCKRKASWRE
jgi:hypothetical protein